MTDGSGPAALAAGLAGLMVAGLVVLAQARRHRRNDAALREQRLRPALGAAAALMLVSVGMAATALALVANRGA